MELLATVAVGLLVGLGAPALAELLRSWRKRGERDAAKTPGNRDDRFWELVGPPIERIADALDRGDTDAARELLNELRKPKP